MNRGFSKNDRRFLGRELEKELVLIQNEIADLNRALKRALLFSEQMMLWDKIESAERKEAYVKAEIEARDTSIRKRKGYTYKVSYRNSTYERKKYAVVEIDARPVVEM